MNWSDLRLGWNPAQYAGVEKLYLPADTIWLPDITVHNTVEGLMPEHSTSQLVEVSHIGHVLMVSVLHAETYCKMTLTGYPRDVHECDVIIGSWMYSAKFLILESWAGGTMIEDVPLSANIDEAIPARDGRSWNLLGRAGRAKIQLVTYECCPDEQYVQLRISLTLKRHAPYLSTQLWLFFLLLPALTAFQFLILPDNDNRIVYGLVVVLAHLVFFVHVSSMVPFSFEPPRIGILATVNLVVSAIALLMSIVIAKTATAPNKLCLKLIQFLPCCGIQDHSAESVTGKHFRPPKPSDETKHLMTPNDTNAVEYIELVDTHNKTKSSESQLLTNIHKEIACIKDIMRDNLQKKQYLETSRRTCNLLDNVLLCVLLFSLIVNIIVLVVL
ncbi:acetylcholine receptor subunit alpha-like isoform X2 [Dreissena polymorpha]|nr:acetylcholine receptor subunit alpha-like isoform X2 [Dreissena polymorpha]